MSTLGTTRQWLRTDHAELKLKEAAGRLTDVCHELALEAGWWHDPHTGERLERNRGETIALMHAELSEALEALRTGANDSHLPERPGVEVELADVVIRVFDAAGGWGLDLAGAIVDKLRYNAQRADHKAENRAAAGGKAF